MHLGNKSQQRVYLRSINQSQSNELPSKIFTGGYPMVFQVHLQKVPNTLHCASAASILSGNRHKIRSLLSICETASL